MEVQSCMEDSAVGLTVGESYPWDKRDKGRLHWSLLKSRTLNLYIWLCWVYLKFKCG